MEQLKTIALEYAHGIYGKNYSVNFLWSQFYEPRIFSEIISRKVTKKLESFSI